MKRLQYLIPLAILVIVLIYINRQRIKKTVIEGINYMLSKEQELFISQLHPVAKQRFRQFISDVQNKTGYRIIITSGFRTFAKQAQLYAQNNSNAKPGYSYHNYGMAIDINAQKGSEYLRKSSPAQQWINSGIIDIADKNGFRWGGRFTGYADNVHFDLGKSYDIAYLYQMATNQYGSDPNNIIGNAINLS